MSNQNIAILSSRIYNNQTNINNQQQQQQQQTMSIQQQQHNQPKLPSSNPPDLHHPRQHSIHIDDYDENGARPNGQLSTSSPAGIAAASAVTPDKLANLLLTQGPLAIRHLTSHLANLIPGFAHLSLSKQRRLIIAALDSGDPITGCIFEKVGWGQWAAKKIGSEAVKQRQLQMGGPNSTHKIIDNDEGAEDELDKIQDLRDSSSPRRDLTKSSSPPSIKKPSEAFGWSKRRESITNQSNDVHATSLPQSPRSSFHNPKKLLKSSNSATANDDAIMSSSDEEENGVFSSDDEEDGLNNKFQYHEIKPMLPGAIQPRSHSQVIYSTSPLGNASAGPFIRHNRPSFSHHASAKGVSKPKVRSRLGSFNGNNGSSSLEMTYENGENLDELMKFRNGRRQSFNESFIRGKSPSSNTSKRISISSITNATNSPLLMSPSSSITNAGTQPITISTHLQQPTSAGHYSSPIVSPSSSLAPNTSSTNRPSVSTMSTTNSNSTSPSYHSDTDEEDWASMGANRVAHTVTTIEGSSSENTKGSISSSNGGGGVEENGAHMKKKNLDFREEAAVYALVNLGSV
ncbi:Stb3 protein [Saccharomycopsis crataegensis]|uniref:Stb3 protein n=1 Tax=Saccharomycopsis crataegensis TaxID=43959 RepID=A0AAV5QS64_9ASCO|nr:Stb3 protein [Saccharomycopsis crataegensis]